MKKTLYYYTIIMSILCLATIGTAGILTAKGNTSAVTFGTSTDIIRLDHAQTRAKLMNYISNLMP